MFGVGHLRIDPDIQARLPLGSSAVGQRQRWTVGNGLGGHWIRVGELGYGKAVLWSVGTPPCVMVGRRLVTVRVTNRKKRSMSAI